MAQTVKHENSFGLLYCAIGEDYFIQATASYRSVLLHNPLLKATLYTDCAVADPVWDQIISTDLNYKSNFHNQMGYKLDSLTRSPYEKTLFLDADTLVLDDLEKLFSLLEKYDLALCHGHNRARRYQLISSSLSKEGKTLFPDPIPYCFSPLQSGLILYNSATCKILFQQAKERYFLKQYYDDQAIIRELLWKSDIRFYILPPEYNFNSLKYLKTLRKSNFEIAHPKVFHYTRLKNQNINRLNKKLQYYLRPKSIGLIAVLKRTVRKMTVFFSRKA